MDDFILKSKFDIFNNLASSGNSSGRLYVFYNVHPAPAIFWEFETPNKNIESPKYDGDRKLESPFEGDLLSIPESQAGGIDEKLSHNPVGNLLTGVAPRVVIGNQNLNGNNFTFYLPNSKFQQIGMLGQNFRVKEVAYKKSKSSKEFGGALREGYAKVKIKGGMTLKIYTPEMSIDWLKARRSVGTFITTTCELYTKKAISIHEASKLLDNITYLLSFANGGYIAPLIINMWRSDFKEIYPSMYSAYAVDSIEHITHTWFGVESDISYLLQCLPAFEKMLKTEPWKSDYDLILTWYFQAIQSSGVHREGKSWPVVANALGAALEKLSSIILVSEMKIVEEKTFNNSRKMDFESKIRRLLETIGISFVGHQMDGHDAVWWFKEMRHSATHPTNKKIWGQEEVNVILGNAIQWVEEALLWRLGYKGKYIDRSRGTRFYILPRYKNTLRKKSW